VSVRNASGQLVPEQCCCGCALCSRTPSSITLQFTGEPSGTGDPSGWIGSWKLAHQSGCVYSLVRGLPCGALSLVGTIYSSGTSGDYALTVIATYPGGIQEGFTAHIAATGNDCVANGNGSPYSVGIGPSSGGPCNFINLLFTPSLLTISSAA